MSSIHLDRAVLRGWPGETSPIGRSPSSLCSLRALLVVSVALFRRRYGEPLLDILVAGGVLAPGGGKVEGTAVSPVSVFQCEPMVEAVRGHLVVSENELSCTVERG